MKGGVSGHIHKVHWIPGSSGLVSVSLPGLTLLRPLLDLNQQAVVRLGNALPTEATTATVDSCPVLQTEMEK